MNYKSHNERKKVVFQLRSLLFCIFSILSLFNITEIKAVVAVTVNDSGDAHAADPLISPLTDSNTVTLRSALEYVNAFNAWVAGDTIAFQIPGDGVHRIQPGGPPTFFGELPTISKKIIIDGYTQGATQNTLINGNNAHLLIEINGNNYQTGDASLSLGNGLTFGFNSGGSIVKGLIINEWICAGINIQTGATGIRIIGNFIGCNASGDAQLANGSGIYINEASNTIIGTSAPADRNIIAGSFGYKTFRQVPNSLPLGASIAINGGSQTVIQNNYIGLDRSGTIALGNSQNGIYAYGANSTFIGGLNQTDGNVISGQLIYGVKLQACLNTLIQENYIGTDVSGTKIIANTGENLGNSHVGIGIYALSSRNNIINNVVSGNGVGIQIGDNVYTPGVTNTSVQGNKIGVDLSGTLCLPNSKEGILICQGMNFIGLDPINPFPDQGNIISCNGRSGITIYGNLTQNVIQGNSIGLDISQSKALGNGDAGVQLGLAGGGGINQSGGAASGNIIGGSDAQVNFIGANGTFGINITSFSTNNSIKNNLFGAGSLANGIGSINTLCSTGNMIIND